MALNIIFAGTPEFAAHHLQALINSEHNVIAVYTQPDRPAGRGKKLKPSAVKALALEHNIPVEQPLNFKAPVADAEVEEAPVHPQTVLANYNADVMVVVAYGLLLPQSVLDTPRYGCLNVHGSILPRWRGAAPIQRAVESGDTETGITIMQMDKGLDTGDMLLKVTCDITSQDTSADLHDRLMVLGDPALLTVLEQVEDQVLRPEQQDNSLACYAEKITKQEAEIHWQESAERIQRMVCAFNPFPVAYTFLQKERIKIYASEIVVLSQHGLKRQKHSAGEIIAVSDTGIIVACGDEQHSHGVLVKSLQIPSKKAMTVKELLNGYSDRFAVGQQFILSNP